MELTLQIFLYPYYAFLVVWGLMSFAAVYHMLRFSFVSFISIAMTVVFVLVSLGILSTSYEYISGINWNDPLNIMPTNQNLF